MIYVHTKTKRVAAHESDNGWKTQGICFVFSCNVFIKALLALDDTTLPFFAALLSKLPLRSDLPAKGSVVKSTRVLSLCSGPVFTTISRLSDRKHHRYDNMSSDKREKACQTKKMSMSRLPASMSQVFYLFCVHVLMEPVLDKEKITWILLAKGQSSSTGNFSFFGPAVSLRRCCCWPFSTGSSVFFSCSSKLFFLMQISITFIILF